MKRIRVVMTQTMYVDCDDEEAGHLLKPYDYTDVYEAVDRFRRIAAHRMEHVESEVSVEAADEDEPWGDSVKPVHSNDRQRYLWSARHFVGKAMYELSSGRYREGHCPDLDRVNGALARLEDEIRLMALDVDGVEWPEVKAWREARKQALASVGTRASSDRPAHG